MDAWMRRGGRQPPRLASSTVESPRGSPLCRFGSSREVRTMSAHGWRALLIVAVSFISLANANSLNTLMFAARATETQVTAQTPNAREPRGPHSQNGLRVTGRTRQLDLD